MVRATALIGICSALCSSQAFVLAPATIARRSSTAVCGATSSGWSCQNHRRREEGRGKSASRGARRGGGRGTLKMKRKVKDSLEEVSEELASKPVALECPRTGETLVCYAERIAVVGGERYLVAFPKDPAVAIAFDENGEVSPVPNDDPIMDELFPLAAACVADLGPGVTLLRTPTTLTVSGLNELVEATGTEDGADGESDGSAKTEGEELQVGQGGKQQEDEEDEAEKVEEEEDEDEEADEVELLGEFLLEGEEFLIVRFLEPILILAKEQAPGKYLLIDEEEEQDTIPVVDEMLCADTSA